MSAENPSAFQGAEASTEAQRRALLGAVAQYGSQGREAIAAQQAQADSARTAAVQAAAGRAGAINAPAALVTQLRQQAAAPADIASRDAALAGQAQAAEMSRLASANGNYMSQVAAATPIVRAQAGARVSQIIAEQQNAEAARQDAAEQRRLDAIEAERGRSFSREQQGWSREDRRFEAEQRRLDTDGDGKPDPQTSPVRTLDEAASIAGISPDQLPAIQQNKSYKELGAGVAAAAAAGESWQQVLSRIRAYEAASGKQYPQLTKLLQAMFYGPGGTNQAPTLTPGGFRSPSSARTRVPGSRGTPVN